jgi:hypothetical protein
MKAMRTLRTLKICRGLWLGPPQNKKESFHMPPAPYILNGIEKVAVMDILKNLKTRTGYVITIQECLAKGKLRFMTLHDYHIMMHQVS